MKRLLGLLLLILLSLSSCESEYEERLEQARELKARMSFVETNLKAIDQQNTASELEDIHEEILFLAKVSGNEKLFLEEVYAD